MDRSRSGSGALRDIGAHLSFDDALQVQWVLAAAEASAGKESLWQEISQPAPASTPYGHEGIFL
ncbi:hypothetical protein JHV56_10370 [Arthrobacter sp. BHU FT2]|nr:hypothetical protein [Arthrobacter sp. BHU FT2]